MDVSELRNYGVAASDAEGRWPKEVRARMRRKGRAVILGHLGFFQRLRFVFLFLLEMRRVRRLDISDIRAQGMSNEAFLAQQREYIATFSVLSKMVGIDRAVAIFDEVMEVTAREPLLLCLPETEEMKRFDDPLAAFREYFRATAEASVRAGCLSSELEEDEDGSFQMTVTGCVWLELARKAGVPSACLPNCTADDLVFPDYFRELGIEYGRTQTLARGGSCCDFRFRRAE